MTTKLNHRNYNKYIKDNAKLMIVDGFVRVMHYQLQKPSVVNFLFFHCQRQLRDLWIEGRIEEIFIWGYICVFFLRKE